MSGSKGGAVVLLGKNAPLLTHVHYVAHHLSCACSDAANDIQFLTLKAPITTAADDKFCDIFPSFRQK